MRRDSTLCFVILWKWSTWTTRCIQLFSSGSGPAALLALSFARRLRITNPRQAAFVVGTSSTSPPSQPLYLQTSSIGFVLWWLVLLVLHGVNVGYYLTAGVLYRTMRFTTIDFQLTTYSIGIDTINYPVLSVIHYVFAGLHTFFMIAMVVGSMHARRLVFLPKIPLRIKKARIQTHSNITLKTQELVPSSLRNIIMRCVTVVMKYSLTVIHSVFGRTGLLGVDHPYFDHMILIQEFVETTLQTIQVYRMSFLLPRL